MQDDNHQENNTQKSTSSSDDQPKKGKKSCILSKLIILICCSSIVFVGLNFINCTFMVPGSIERTYLLGGLKNNPSLKCEDAQKSGFDALITLLTTMIALKTKFD